MHERCPTCGTPSVIENGSPCKQCGYSPEWQSSTVPVGQGAILTLESRRNQSASLAEGKRYAVVILNGEMPGQVIPIEKAHVTLGRADCDIVVDDPQISRQHAVLSVSGLQARIEDLGSSNGLYIGDNRVQAAELSDRSEFRLGNHEFVFVVRDEESRI